MRFWRVPAWPQCERDGSAVILMYHSVSRIGADPWGLRVAPRQFAEHMAVLRTHTNPIRLDELASATVGDGTRRPVVVTFDDGYADNLLHALPILERYRIHATIFVATGFVGSQRE